MGRPHAGSAGSDAGGVQGASANGKGLFCLTWTCAPNENCQGCSSPDALYGKTVPSSAQQMSTCG